MLNRSFFRSGRSGSLSDTATSRAGGPSAGPSSTSNPVESSTTTLTPSRQIVHRSYSTSTPSSSSALPSYGSGTASISDAPIPTYESVLSESANRIRVMRASALATSNYQSSSDTSTRRPGPSESAIALDDEGEDDDPLVPRIRRNAPTPVLRPLRRNTFSGTSSEADAAGSVRLGPVREGPLTPPVEVHTGGDGDDILRERDNPMEEERDEEEAHAPPPALSPEDRPTQIDPNRHALVPVGPGGEISATIDLPAPPLNALPAYSAHLGPQELRLISTVHLDESHPAAAFFAALANSSVSAAPTPPVDPQREQPMEYSAGGKKVKVFVKRGGMRMNQTQTGPLYIKVGRGGRIEGRVEVGKVDYATSLEISIIGLVNTSYYVRGQYTLIDTLPLVRRQLVLYPTPPDESPAPQDLGPENLYGIDSAAPAVPAVPATASSGPSSAAPPTTATTTTTGTATPAPATAPAPATPTAAPILSRTISRPSFLKPRKTNPNSKIMTKDGVLYLTQGQTFDFSLVMPNQHYRDSTVELPPSCQIYQVGMQAGVEYVLRVKMGRKGWRLNETITIPIVYEPRAYITPRRLRALTTDDPMNPGWRTIRLHGGKPSPKTNTNPPQPEPPAAPGVEGILLLPSPPIVYIAHAQPPPPIPFHLHFHSPLTLPLSTFSDPRESNFIIRLMRVATLRIGSEKEIRRMEIPSSVEIWQEGGPRVRLGDEGSVSGQGVSVRVVDPGPPPPPAFTEREREEEVPEEQEQEVDEMEARRDENGEVWETLEEEQTEAEVEAREGTVTRAQTSQPARTEGNVNTVPTLDTAPAVPTAPVPHPASSPVAAPASLARVTSTASVTLASPTSPTSPTASTDTGRRRLSFLRRRSSTSTPSPSHSTQPESTLSRILSNIPPSISESADPGPSTASAPAEPPQPPALFTPLSLGSTDVHLMGELTIPHKITGTEVIRRMVQSFNTSDVSITYVLEVGIQPKRGAVKEAFEHLWGGGIVEIVLGHKEEEAVEPAAAGGSVGAEGSGTAVGTATGDTAGTGLRRSLAV